MQEFSAISVSSYEAETLASKLNEQSAEGWEVVSIVPSGSTITAYLSRAAPATGPDTISEPIVDAELVGERSEPPAATETAVEDFGGEETGPIETIEQPVDEVADEVDTLGAVEPTLPEAADIADVGGPASSDFGSTDAKPSTPSLADEVAALVPQIESEETPAGAADEPAGWAVGATSTSTAKPVEAAETPAAATPAAAEPAAAKPATESTTTAAATAAMAPAGWYADPSGRYELRYWDGTQWTEHVSRAGQQYTDPPVA